jgi:hypothetical protein
MIPGETVLSQGPKAETNPHYSEFKVMRSHGGAGYYIGTMYLDCGEPNCKECGDYAFGRERKKGTELDYNSRETDYFEKREDAEAALEQFKKSGFLDQARY